LYLALVLLSQRFHKHLYYYYYYYYYFVIIYFISSNTGKVLVLWNITCSRSVLSLLLVWKVMVYFDTLCCHLSWSHLRLWCGTSI